MTQALVRLLCVGILLAGCFGAALSASAQAPVESQAATGQTNGVGTPNPTEAGNSGTVANPVAATNPVAKTAPATETTPAAETAPAVENPVTGTNSVTETAPAAETSPIVLSTDEKAASPASKEPTANALDWSLKFGDETFTLEEQQSALKAFSEIYAWLDRLIAEHDQLTEELAKATEEGNEPRIHELSEKQHRVMAQVHALYRKARSLSKPAWVADPQNDAVRSFMLFLLATALEEDQYEAAYNIVREMMAKKIHLTDPVLYELAGITSFMMNKYDVARLCFNEALRNEKLTAVGSAYKEQIPYYLDVWKTEQALRNAEAKKGDNPRVLIQTTKGDVVVELFEDNAPNTVANFIALVEQGFYTDCSFHTVISGFMAQTGSPLADGTGNPGYSIPDEYDRPDARRHFRGSLSMAHTAEPNSAGSQFFITLVPARHLDGKYTVFGRVVSGMEVIALLERTDTTQVAEDGSRRADKILQAKVLRKRNHAYVPQTLPLPQEPQGQGAN